MIFFSFRFKNHPNRKISGQSHMMIGEVEAKFLQFLVEMTNSKDILELGTFVGYSSLAFAESLERNEKKTGQKGRIITCEIDPEIANIAEENFKLFPHLHSKVFFSSNIKYSFFKYI